MLDVVFTSDYEIHGNGEGSPRELMLEPTDRMLALFERYGAKLTVLADVCEILRFRRHLAETGVDDFDYEEIAAQLRDAVARGHDVQLHLHPAYLNARLTDDGWELDYSEYDLARLSAARINEIIAEGKAYLEELLRDIDGSYRCVASRSANWSMQPTGRLARALVANGFAADTSVFKFGRRDAAVRFDYGDAPSALVPWRIDHDEVCRVDPRGQLLELPIYCERVPLPGFVSLTRVVNAVQVRRHPVRRPPGRDSGCGRRRAPGARALGALVRRHPRKLDFNQCTGRQLIGSAERASRRYDDPDRELPLILIGHSKLFGRRNERQLERFLRHVAAHPDRYRFATLCEALTNLRAPGLDPDVPGLAGLRPDPNGAPAPAPPAAAAHGA